MPTWSHKGKARDLVRGNIRAGHNTSRSGSSTSITLGHYMRRIKSVSLTVPCVTGPYTGLHCKLQQLCSTIRFRPLRSTKNTYKCYSVEKNKKEEEDAGASTLQTACHNDPHVWKRYAGKEAIATSAGQNDSGLFELNFNDPRYLPFEYTGAVPRRRIELPPENNQFDFNSLSDLIMQINFTAREGGPEFAREGNTLAQQHLPGDGWRFFDIRHEMTEAWNVVRKDTVCDACKCHREEEYSECCAGGDHGKCRCRKEKHHSASSDHGQKDAVKGWCEKCRKNHRDQERRCYSPYEQALDDEATDSHSHGNEYHQRKPCHSAHRRGKEPPRHAKREFHLTLTRNQFPFLTAHRGVAITSLHFLFDTKDCDPSTAKVCFTPPPHFPEEVACIDTVDIPLVPAEGGMLKGSLVLKHPFELEDRSCDPRGKGELIGKFSLPCELKGVCNAWLFVGTRRERRVVERRSQVGVGGRKSSSRGLNVFQTDCVA